MMREEQTYRAVRLLAVLVILVGGTFAAVPRVLAGVNPVRIPADIEWVNTGVLVEAGQTVYVEANGVAITAPLKQFPGAKSGPGGQVWNLGCGEYSGAPPPCALDGAPYGALVGRVGPQGSPFLIGGASSFIPPASGPLYLTVNDNLGFYQDNLAGFTAVLNVPRCPAGDVCVTVKSKGPIRIGYMLVLTGPSAALGIDARRGIEIAIDDRGGMLLGHKIELIGQDTGCNPEGGQAAAEIMSADSKLAAVVGTSCSNEARAAVPIMCEQKIPMISPSNTAPDLTDPDRPTSYWCYMRTAHNDKVQGAAMAQYAWEAAGAQRAATCYDGSLYTNYLRQAFADTFQQYGGTITFQATVGPDDEDMTPMLTEVAATAPDFFYYPTFLPAGARITAQAKLVPGMETVALAASDALFTPELLAGAGDAAVGMLLSHPDVTAYGSGYSDFLVKYRAKYGEDPIGPFHAQAYDAASIILRSIEQVAIEHASGLLLIPRKALHDAMAATSGFEGLTGTLTCDPYGDCAAGRIAVYQITSGDPATWNPGAEVDSNPRRIWP